MHPLEHLEGHAGVKDECRSVVELQAQLTEGGRWCGRRWMRARPSFAHYLRPSHRTAASKAALQIRAGDVRQQPGPAMTECFGCTVVFFSKQVELVTLRWWRSVRRGIFGRPRHDSRAECAIQSKRSLIPAKQIA